MEESGVGLRERLCGICSEPLTLADVVADSDPTAVLVALVSVAADILAADVEHVPGTFLCRSTAVLVVSGVCFGGCRHPWTANRLLFVAVDRIHPEDSRLRIAAEMVRYRVSIALPKEKQARMFQSWGGSTPEGRIAREKSRLDCLGH